MGITTVLISANIFRLHNANTVRSKEQRYKYLELEVKLQSSPCANPRT